MASLRRYIAVAGLSYALAAGSLAALPAAAFAEEASADAAETVVVETGETSEGAAPVPEPVDPAHPADPAGPADSGEETLPGGSGEEAPDGESAGGAESDASGDVVDTPLDPSEQAPAPTVPEAGGDAEGSGGTGEAQGGAEGAPSGETTPAEPVSPAPEEAEPPAANELEPINDAQTLATPAALPSGSVQIGLSASEVVMGRTVTFAPKISGGDPADYVYNYVWNYNGDWSDWDSTMKDGSAPTSEQSWSFAPKRAGRYALHVDVTDPASGVVVGTADAWVTVRSPASLPAGSVSLGLGSSTVACGKTLTVTPKISGGDPADYVYNYVWNYNGDWSDWDSTMKDGSAPTSEQSWSFAPKRAGRYALHVDVVDPASGVVVGTADAWVTATNMSWDLSISADASELRVGVPVAIGSAVSGADAKGFTYNYVWNYNGSWSPWDSAVNRNNGQLVSDTSWSFTPSKAGRYLLHIDARDPYGQVKSKEMWVTVADEGLSYTALSVDKSSGLAYGDSVHIKPQYTASTSDYLEFKYTWSRSSDGASGVIKDWSNSAEIDWALTVTGDVTLTATIRDSAGNEVARSTRINAASAQWSYDGISSSAELIRLGQQITVSPKVSGETGHLSYKYVWQKNGWAEWGVISGPAEGNTTLTWTPPSTGDYTIYCDVIGTDGKVTIKTCTVSVWNVNGLNVSWQANNSWNVSVDLGIANPAKWGFQYNYVWNYGGNWSSWGSTVKDTGGYTTSTSWRFSPSTAGYYTLHVDVSGPGGSYGSADSSVVTYTGAEYNMWSRIRNYTSPTQYLLACDTSSCYVGVYKSVNGQWVQQARWLCSPGAWSTPTVKGVFQVGIKMYYFDSYGSRQFYATQFYGDYLFHSTLYYTNGAVMDNRLGQHLSHGCVRLATANAKWIYDNVPSGTTVVVW